MERKVLHERIQYVGNKWWETYNQPLSEAVILRMLEMMIKWSFELQRLNIAHKH